MGFTREEPQYLPWEGGDAAGLGVGHSGCLGTVCVHISSYVEGVCADDISGNGYQGQPYLHAAGGSFASES